MDLDKTKLLLLYPEFDKVYGPYTQPSGRKHVILTKTQSTDIRKTISYPKALVEVSRGHCLLSEETVDHEDRNFQNNEIQNLTVRERKLHSQLDALRVEVSQIDCPICSKSFTPRKDQINTRAQTKAGPFCSKQCVGKYGSSVQAGKETLSRTPFGKRYYTLKDND